ncbi:aminoglycoside phosphotransferase family protein [Arthrobacter sp. 35W]|uniref:aminoglycoside phosphotransferase family protein n=1 Tax=Arthrobacter sp. 35W TaxID=1132441 RepID=UPI000414E3CE|nr:aminoglycoside phosphotransferase family protein [Arthrobacter sp. 35W]
MSAVVPIPADLTKRYSNSTERRAWLQSLPSLLEASLQRWELAVDLPLGTEPWNGYSGIVVPVWTATGAKAVLKVAFPYDESLLEPTALQLWNGRGAVRLLAHDEASCSTLLDRLDDGRSLISVPMDDAVDVWGTLLRRLSISPDDRPGWERLPRIADTAEIWSDDLPMRWEELGRPFSRWMLEAALEVCQTRGAVSRRSQHDVLVHTDLHYLNILGRPGRTDYAAIDPQPSIGEAEFAVAPCLWNRIGDLSHADPAAALRDRCAQLCEAAGLDVDVAVQWSIAREVENALWYVAKGDHEGDAQRSLWVASTLAGKTLAELPAAHDLKVLT